MPRTNLNSILREQAGITQLYSEVSSLTPSTEVAFYIEKGHAMEIIDIWKPAKVVALFFGPGEFAVKCHPCSKLASLDNTSGNLFTHGQIIEMLRKFPELHHHYRIIRQKYLQKVAARIKSLALPEKDRYADMIKTQPWIPRLAKPQDIAAYLYITPEKLRKFMK